VYDRHLENILAREVLGDWATSAVVTGHAGVGGGWWGGGHGGRRSHHAMTWGNPWCHVRDYGMKSCHSHVTQ